MSIDELINQKYSSFSESDKAVWKYIATHRIESEKMSINDMAQKCFVSRTAVMRFSQKLGFHGFAEFKFYLKMENQTSEISDQIDQACNTYQNVADSIRKKDCDKMFEVMDSARHIYICGEGMVQTSIQKEFKRIFSCAGCILYDVPNGEELFNLLPQITENDFCILISVTGENEKILQVARQLLIRGTPVLSITKKRENTLAHLCDYRLYIESSNVVETPIHWIYESTTSYFILIDILFLKYIEYHNRKDRKDENRAADRGTLRPDESQ